LRIDHVEPAPSQLEPQDGFSAFFSPQDNGFTLGGFDVTLKAGSETATFQVAT
jgi:hypothetical protein